MREALEGKQAGESVVFTYEPRLCIPRRKESLVLTLGRDRLRRKTVSGEPIVPRQGRFYPQGHIDGLLDVYPDTLTPFRLIDLDDETFTADRNHPLADVPVTIEARIQYLEKRDTGTYGSLTHWREATCDWGPGMQAMLDGEPTDFFHPDFFHRATALDENFRPPEPDAAALRNYQNILARSSVPACASGPLPKLRAPYRPIRRGGLPLYAGIHGPARGHPALHRPLSDTRRARGPGLHRGLRPGTGPSGAGRTPSVRAHGTGPGISAHGRFTKDLGTVSMRNDWRDRDDPVFLETKGVSDPVYVACGHKPE